MQSRGAAVALVVVLTLLSACTAFLPLYELPIILMLLPAVGMVVGAVLPKEVVGRAWGLAISVATFVISVVMAWHYNWGQGGYQFEVSSPAMQILGMRFSLGVDQISLSLVLLTTLLHPIAVLASFRSIQTRTREHYALLSFLLVTMIGTFMATDLLLFYAFFEMSLIPLFFVIGIWGGKQRRKAANMVFLYTFAGSVFAMAGILYLGIRAHTFYIPEVVAFAQSAQFGWNERFWVLISLLIAFGVKTPLFPVHTWLPLAHVEAPTAGNADLSALVLKLGTYGLLRIALPIGLISDRGTVQFPIVLHVLAVLCLIGILYAALVAWVQTDIKKLIAYSSVSHLGVCVLGMLALNLEGMSGSVLYMINHGLSSAGLFLIIGMIYNRYHTRDIREISGLARAMPIMACFMVFFVMAAVGLPGLNGFVSEILSLVGAFTSTHLGMKYGIIAAIGIVLSAFYMLKFGSGLLFGPLRYPVLTEDRDTHETIHPKYVMGGDITGREVAMLLPLAAGVLVLGVYPWPLLKSLETPLNAIRHGSGTDASALVLPAPEMPHTTASIR